MKSARALAIGAMALLTSTAAAAPPSMDVTPNQINFGNQRFGTFTKQSFAVTNKSDATVIISIESIIMGDDFSPGQVESTCPLTEGSPLAPGQNCTQVIGFQPSQFFAGHEAALMRVIARDLSGKTLDTRDVRLTGRGY